MDEKVVKEMSNFEIWSLFLTGIYNLLTFLLLAFTAYIAIFQRRIPNIAFFYDVVPKDTKSWGWRRSNIDFVLENRGIELKNVTIRSEPNDLGWANIGEDIGGISPKTTSEYFQKAFPFLPRNYRRSFFWCDAQANKDVLAKPIKVVIEFDNPMFVFPKRKRREFEFDFSPKGILDGVNGKFDEHNIAQEMTRTRESLESICEKLDEVIVGLEPKPLKGSWKARKQKL